jgi:phage-related minor tail protein
MSVSADEIKVLLTADSSSLQEGMAQAAASTISAVQAQMAAFGELDSLLAGHTATLEQLQAQEQALDTLQQAGLVSTQELTEAFAALDAAEASLVASTEAVTAAQVESNAAMSLTGGTARELGVMIGELARGNYTRLEGSTITLANRTGLLQAAFTPLGAGILAAGVAVGTLVDWMIKGAEQSEQLQASIIATGDASGFSYGQLEEMATGLRSTITTAGQADEIMLRLSQSGRNFGGEMQAAGQATADMSALTGQSIDKVVDQFVRLNDDPVKALRSLNSAYNLVTVPEAQEIKRLQDMGDKAGAAAEAIRDIAKAEQQRAAQLAQSEGYVGHFVDVWKSGFSNMEAAVMSWGAPSTLQQQLNKNTEELNQFIQYAQDRFQEVNGKLTFNSAGYAPAEAKQINDLIAQRESLQQQITAEQEKQAQLAKQAADNQDGVNNALGKDDDVAQLQEELRKQEDLQKVSYDQRAQFEADYWQKVYETAAQGSQEQVEAWQQMQSAERALDEQQLESWRQNQEQMTEAARKTAEAERQAHAATLTGLEEERNATQQDTAARIQADNTVLQSAIQMYGMRSSQAKSALSQMLADEKSYDAAVEAAQEDQLQQEKATNAASYADAKALTAEKMQADQEAYRSHQISASEFLSSEKAVTQQALDDYAQFTAQKIALDRGNVKALEDDAKDWVTGSNAILKQYQADNNEVAKIVQQDWNRTSTDIANAVGRGFEQIIFSNQSMSQKLEQEAQQVSERIVQQLVTNVVKHFLEGQAQQTAATAAGAAQRNSITSASSLAGLAMSASMDESQILNAAKTAAANAYASASAIPVIGWLLGPVAAAAAFVGVEAYGNISSAAGGWDDVNADQLAMIHKNEMILPAHIADYVRSGAQQFTSHAIGGGGWDEPGGGGTQFVQQQQAASQRSAASIAAPPPQDTRGGDTHHWNINAMDGKSVARVLSSNPEAIRKAASRAMNPGGRRRR